MTLNDVITRLDAIATDRYPIITDSDIDALKIAMDNVKKYQSIVAIIEKEYKNIYPTDADVFKLDLIKAIIDEREWIIKNDSFDTKMLMNYENYMKEREKMSSISATQYGQIMEEEK